MSSPRSTTQSSHASPPLPRPHPIVGTDGEPGPRPSGPSRRRPRLPLSQEGRVTLPVADPRLCLCQGYRMDPDHLSVVDGAHTAMVDHAPLPPVSRQERPLHPDTSPGSVLFQGVSSSWVLGQDCPRRSSTPRWLEPPMWSPTQNCWAASSWRERRRSITMVQTQVRILHPTTAGDSHPRSSSSGTRAKNTKRPTNPSVRNDHTRLATFTRPHLPPFPVRYPRNPPFPCPLRPRLLVALPPMLCLVTCCL